MTAGGVGLDEVDSRTMQSKRQPGLYLAGEVLDLDGSIGGYNFQSAWSTGWLAGGQSLTRSFPSRWRRPAGMLRQETPEPLLMNLLSILPPRPGLPAASMREPLPRQKLYVANSAGNDLHVIDTATNKVIKRVEVGPQPHGLVATADGDRLFLTIENTDGRRGGTRSGSTRPPTP